MNTLSIVIPVYNEEKRISKTIKALSKGFSFYGVKLDEVIFVNDGSTDKTRVLIKNAQSKLSKPLKAKISLISYRINRGKGYAVRKGMLASKSDYTLFFDADISTPISEFKKFLPFIRKNLPVIIGTRKNGESTVKIHQPKYREYLGRGFTLLANIILNTWVTDFTCGFKVFSCEAKGKIFSQSRINRWGYDAEALFLARKFGFPIQEKAVSWSNDNETKVDLLKDLPRSLVELFQIRVNWLRIILSERVEFLVQLASARA